MKAARRISETTGEGFVKRVRFKPGVKERGRYGWTIQHWSSCFAGRLSEQARRQLEKTNTKFEDLSLGDRRPTQLIRRYGNLYTEGRLDALDALDDVTEMTEFNDLKGKLLLTILVVSFVRRCWARSRVPKIPTKGNCLYGEFQGFIGELGLELADSYCCRPTTDLLAVLAEVIPIVV